MLSLLWLLLTTPAATPASSKPTTPTVEPAVLAFATEVEHGLQAGDPSVLDERVDLERLLERATRDIPASPALLEELTRDMRESGLWLGRQLLASRDESLRVRLLQVRMHQGAPRALFRLLSSSGLNYYDYELARNARGEVVIVDIYPYMAGELFTESLRRVFLMAAAEKARGVGQERAEGERGLMDNMPRLRRIQRLLDAREYQEAVEEFARLPPSVLADKSFQLMRLKALAQLEGPEYPKALRAFEKAFPEDPVWDLLSLDSPRLEDNPAEMMRALDRLDRKVHDPYLHYLRGVVKLREEDWAGARRFFLETIQAEPSLFEPYLELLALVIEERDYAQAILVLEGLERDAGVGVEGVRILEGSADFLESPEYKAWLRRRSQRERLRNLAPPAPRPTGGSL